MNYALKVKRKGRRENMFYAIIILAIILLTIIGIIADALRFKSIVKKQSNLNERLEKLEENHLGYHS